MDQLLRRESATMSEAGRERAYQNLLRTLILHFRPRTVPERTLRFSLTWGLGGSAVVLLLLLIGTGLLLKFAYQPVPEKAYASVLRLTSENSFGRFVRNVHHWSGHLLLLVAFLHSLRVFFTGAFHRPRQLNWIVGLGLLFTVMISNFTGYLLPYDQLSYWAVTITTGMLVYVPGAGPLLQQLIVGGTEVGAATLSNFYAIHTAVLPAMLIGLAAFHFWRVRKAGGLVVPRRVGAGPLEARKDRVPAVPNLLLRELVVGTIVIAAIFLFAALSDAPLGNKANPGLSPNPTRAPWYFAGFQEMLIHFHPFFALCLIPSLMLAALVAIPYLHYPEDTAGVWFVSAVGRHLAVKAGAAGALATVVLVLVSEHLHPVARWWPGLSPGIANGLVPFLLLLAVVAGVYALLIAGRQATRNEAVQTVFVLLLAAFVTLTIVGIFFRGEGMALVFPWRT